MKIWFGVREKVCSVLAKPVHDGQIKQSSKHNLSEWASLECAEIVL